MSLVVSGYGITSQLPPGWEGRITNRADGGDAAMAGAAMAASGSEPAFGERPSPVAHLANFALPPERGDFGSGAVEGMGAEHVLVVLFEYGPESLGTALFAPAGMPRRLRPDQFSPRQLQRMIPGQAGYQAFFTEQDRPFCLYVVVGSHQLAPLLAGQTSRVLAATTIERR